MTAPRVLAIDFDRVLHDVDHPIPGRRMGAPMEGAVEAMRQLEQEGWKLVVHTIWPESGHGTIEKWLEYYKVPYHEVTNIKPNAAAYIDDRAIHHTRWSRTLVEVNAL